MSSRRNRHGIPVRDVAAAKEWLTTEEPTEEPKTKRAKRTEPARPPWLTEDEYEALIELRRNL